MASAYLGSIIIFGGNYAPRGYAFCNGQILSISQNTALFAILGTTYGGNGQTNFALPDLRGRAPIHFGQGAGTSAYVQGETAGTETVTLTVAQLPSHTHTVLGVSTLEGTSETPSAALGPAAGGSYATPTIATATGIAGSNTSVSIVQPVLALNYIIAIQGIFPSRN